MIRVHQKLHAEHRYLLRDSGESVALKIPSYAFPFCHFWHFFLSPCLNRIADTAMKLEGWDFVESVIKVEHGSDGFPSWPGEMLSKIKIKYFTAGGCVTKPSGMEMAWEFLHRLCKCSFVSIFFVKLSRFNFKLITFKIENITID